MTTILSKSDTPSVPSFNNLPRYHFTPQGSSSLLRGSETTHFQRQNPTHITHPRHLLSFPVSKSALLVGASARRGRQSEDLTLELLPRRGRRPRQLQCHKQLHPQVGGMLLLQGSNTPTDVEAGGGPPLAGGAKGREVETGAVARVQYLQQRPCLTA